MSDDSFTIFGIVKPSRRLFEERFWGKSLKGEGCWEWSGSVNKTGYGKFAVARCRMFLAHRVAWELTNGIIPADTRVLHSCDNTSCVRPDHLFLGTAKDNTQDMLAKGREARGERHGHAKLTAAVVREMCRLRAALGLSFREIGERFGVNASAVWKVVTGKRWKHVARE